MGTAAQDTDAGVLCCYSFFYLPLSFLFLLPATRFMSIPLRLSTLKTLHQ
jgi:hypothetical protein